MAELADAPDLGSGVLDVGVRASLSAPSKREKFLRFFLFTEFREGRILTFQGVGGIM